jgi:hypothetical protein
MNTLTPGIAAQIKNGLDQKEFARLALVAEMLLGFYDEPSMIVGRPGSDRPAFEDNGRTLILPLPAGYPKIYATRNEIGGITLMLADEY